MKQHWKRLVRRLEALSLRERVIMAASIAAALLAAADAAILSPQYAAQHRLLEKLQRQDADLQALRARLVAPAADTPHTRLTAMLAGQQAELQRVDQAIESQLAGQAPATLPALLRNVLRRHERLTLLGLETVAPATTAGAGDAPAPRLVKIQLAGRYADLTAYAGAIEQQMPGLRWHELTLDASTRPPVLSAQLWLGGGGS